MTNTHSTVGMFDSLPYRNDAAIVLRRLIRSLPTRQGVIGVATCDKGLAGDDDGAGPGSTKSLITIRACTITTPPFGPRHC